ncbi:unnamed protein product [Alopecurus aequalis]
MGVRGVAAMYVVLGLSVACFALYAITLDPATFRQLQLQVSTPPLHSTSLAKETTKIIKESDPHPPEQGQTDCAATAAEAMDTRADAVLLLLLGAAQALMAMAAVAGTSRVCTFLSLFVSAFTALKLHAVLAGVVRLAIGRCHADDSFHQLLVAGYVGVLVSLGMLWVVGLVVTLWANTAAQLA